MIDVLSPDIQRDWNRTGEYYKKIVASEYYSAGWPKGSQNVLSIDAMIPSDVKTILDVGSGKMELGYTAQADLGTGIDFHWLPYPDNAFDLIRARHALEHSPMPAFALMEWRRVAAKYILIAMPEPSPYISDYPGHWSCFPDYGWRAIIRKCGLKIIRDELGQWLHGISATETVTLNEYRFLCGKA